MDVMDLLYETKRALTNVVNEVYDSSIVFGLGLERHTIETEFSAAGLFIAGADNDISADEVELLNFLFDMSVTLEDMPMLIPVLKNIYNDLIVELQMPGWKICKTLDNANGSSAATDMYISTMRLVMSLFASVDGNVDAAENKLIDNFIARMEKDRL